MDEAILSILKKTNIAGNKWYLNFFYEILKCFLIVEFKCLF